MKTSRRGAPADNHNGNLYRREDGGPVLTTRIYATIPVSTNRKVLRYLALSGQTISQLVTTMLDSLPDPEAILATQPDKITALVNELTKQP